LLFNSHLAMLAIKRNQFNAKVDYFLGVDRDGVSVRTDNSG
jgi:hypothetical protein